MLPSDKKAFSRIKWFPFFPLLLIAVIFFQNCSQNGFQTVLSSTVSTSSVADTQTTSANFIKLKIAWDKSTSSGIKGYKLLIGNKSGQYDSLIDVGLTDTPDSPTYELTTLKADTEYFITTIAYSDSIESKPSNELHIRKTQ